MRTLTAYQVKKMVEENPNIKLVMTLGPHAFAKSHIPNSLNIWSMESASELFPKSTEIIVYCSDVTCMASYQAYKQLERAGYSNIWRFAGGLIEWDKAGFPLV